MRPLFSEIYKRGL